MSDHVKTKAVLKVMGDLGFKETRTGNHIILRHANGTVVTVPGSQDTLRPLTLAATARQVANNGIVAEGRFKELLRREMKLDRAPPGLFAPLVRQAS